MFFKKMAMCTEMRQEARRLLTAIRGEHSEDKTMHPNQQACQYLQASTQALPRRLRIQATASHATDHAPQKQLIRPFCRHLEPRQCGRTTSGQAAENQIDGMMVLVFHSPNLPPRPERIATVESRHTRVSMHEDTRVSACT